MIDIGQNRSLHVTHLLVLHMITRRSLHILYSFLESTLWRLLHGDKFK